MSSSAAEVSGMEGTAFHFQGVPDMCWCEPQAGPAVGSGRGSLCAQREAELIRGVGCGHCPVCGQTHFVLKGTKIEL